MQVVARFLMHCQHICTEFRESVDVTIWVNNHQVHIERLLGMSRNGLHHGHAKADVGNKHTVHHIEMKPMRCRSVDHFNITLKVGKVGSQQRRSKKMGHATKVSKRDLLWTSLWVTCEEGAPLYHD